MTSSTDRGPVRVEINVEARPTTGTYEIPRAEWDAMTPAQRRRRLDDMVGEEIGNAGGAGWHIADPDDEWAAVGRSEPTMPISHVAALLSASTGGTAIDADALQSLAYGVMRTYPDQAEPNPPTGRAPRTEPNPPAPAGPDATEPGAAMRSAAQYAAAVEALLRRPRAYRTTDPEPTADVLAVTNGFDAWQRSGDGGWIERDDPMVPLDERALRVRRSRRRMWGDLPPLLVVDATQPVDWVSQGPLLPAGVRAELAATIAALTDSIGGAAAPGGAAASGESPDGTANQ